MGIVRLRQLVTFGLATLAMAASAEARTVRTEPYPTEQTWNAAIRLVRVDLGLTITERDPSIGYFTFEYREGNRTMPGSMEIIPTEIDGRHGARIVVQVAQMPTYVESMILTRLGRKLRDEFGEPVAAVRRPAPSDPPREGSGGSGGGNDDPPPGSPIQPRDRPVVPQNPRLSTDPVPDAGVR